MLEGDIKILRDSFEAFNRGDADARIAAWHPEGELYELVAILDAPDVYRGHEGVREWLANAQSIVGRDFRMEPQPMWIQRAAALLRQARRRRAEVVG